MNDILTSDTHKLILTNLDFIQDSIDEIWNDLTLYDKMEIQNKLKEMLEKEKLNEH